jgi:hypothetical protein
MAHQRPEQPRRAKPAPLPGDGLARMKRRNKRHVDRRKQAARMTCRGAMKACD